MKQFRNAIFTIILLQCAGAAFLSGCTPPIPADNEFAYNWSYAPAHQTDTWQTAWAKNYTAISGKINETNLAALLPDKSGFIWIKKDFILPDTYKDKEISVILGRILIADETWLNGEVIGRKGKFPPAYFSGWNSLRNYRIQNALLHEGKNTLLVKIFCEGEGAVIGDVMIGEEKNNYKLWESDALYNTMINLISSFIILFFGLHHLIIFYNRPKDRANLYFALLCLCSSLYQTNFFITWIPGIDSLDISYLIFQKFIFSIIAVIYLLFSYFIRDFLDIRGRKSTRVIFLIITGAAILTFAAAPDYQSFLKIRNFPQLIYIPFSIYPIVLIIIATKNKNREALFILFAGFIMCAFIGYDIVYHILMKVYSGVYLGGLGFIIFLISLAAILARRYAKDRNEIEELNVSLEQKVADRTSELTLVNHELKTMNQVLKDTQKKIMSMAITDPLTGLYNRQELARKLEEEQIKLDRLKDNYDSAILFIDLDNFKNINDTFGHAAGDTVLTSFAEILKRSSRLVDFIARFGGDEFVIIMFSPKNGGPAKLAQRILDDFANSIARITGIFTPKNAQETPQDKPLACSIGIATWKTGLNINGMMNAADKALYEAKKQGKNRFVLK